MTEAGGQTTPEARIAFWCFSALAALGSDQDGRPVKPGVLSLIAMAGQREPSHLAHAHFRRSTVDKPEGNGLGQAAPMFMAARRRLWKDGESRHVFSTLKSKGPNRQAILSFAETMITKLLVYRP